MPNKKGFTMMELIVVLVIVGILAAAAVPSYMSLMQQGAAKAAQNNLTSIYNAEKSLYFSSGNYYISAACPDTLTNINNGLSLNISDTKFTYCCANTGGFQCTATNVTDSNLKLILSNSSIILPGGTGCTASPWNAPCNPTCATDVSTYCPNS